MDYNKLKKLIREWFLETKRDLPWRHSRSPYATWIAEVMLQQTQSSVVIPYFERWMAAFPTIDALANAKEEAVIKQWEGLGYYSRARNLHLGAKTIVERFQGQIPSTKEELLQIKGIGPYTVGAILSFAFLQKSPAVDGNVIRVITRLFSLDEDVGKESTKKKIYTLTEKLLPDDEPWINAEALIELGALICKKSPICQECPLKSDCLSYKNGSAKELPLKKRPPAITNLIRQVAIIKNGDRYLIYKESEKIMQGLHQFPYSEGLSENPRALFEEKLSLNLTLTTILDEVTHSFTRYKVTLYPYLFETSDINVVEPNFWSSTLDEHSFSSGHRKIKEQLYAHVTT